MTSPEERAEVGATLQQQARALGDPTRHAIFRAVAEAEEPVGVGELAERHRLHPNAVRQHLAKLVAAGLVTEGKAAPNGPGRPRLVYRVAAGADSRWGVVGPYERLSRMLAEAVRTGRTPLDVGRDEGRRRALPAGDPAATAEGLRAAMDRDGFDPEVRRGRGRIEVALRRCPYESTAVADPATVCALHRGIAEGLVEGVPGVAVADLEARDPRVADCCLSFSVDG